MPLPDGRSPTMLIKAVRAILDFCYLAQYSVHSTETLALLEDALWRFHDNKVIFEHLGIWDIWEIPKLLYACHYVLMIMWLGSAALTLSTLSVCTLTVQRMPMKLQITRMNFPR